MNKRNDDKLTSNMDVNDPDTGPIWSKSVISGFKWIPPGWSGSEKISSRYFAIRTKHKNLAGRSGSGVLVVVRLSWIGAVKKTCLTRL